MNGPRQRKEPLGTSLVHHYAVGLRFDTQVKHAARTTRGLQLRHVAFPLGFLNEHADPAGGRMSLIRALSILNQVNARQIDESSVPHPEDEVAMSPTLDRVAETRAIIEQAAMEPPVLRLIGQTAGMQLAMGRASNKDGLMSLKDESHPRDE